MRTFWQKAARVAAVAGPGTLFLSARAAHASLSASTGLDSTATGSGLMTSGSLPQVIGTLIGGLLGLLGTVFIVLIIYAGFLWMTAQGSDEKVKQAKKIIQNAVIGLVVVFSSYAIVNFVLDAISSSISASPATQSAQTNCARQLAAGLPCEE